MVGVHPRNRDGAGVAVQEVHALLADILDTGFVQILVSALAFEVTGPEASRRRRMTSSMSMPWL